MKYFIIYDSSASQNLLILFYIFKNIVKMFESHVKAVDDVQIVGVNRK